jgi:O-antigen ligase
MFNNVKALIVVLLLAAPIFRFSKPVAILFSNEPDFLRRRNMWFVLTILGFLSPSFWLFALIAAPLLIWAGRKDSNPVALYILLLNVISPIRVNIPIIGINELFSLDMYRLLSFCVLIPVAGRLRQSQKEMGVHRTTTMDVLLLAYGALQILLFVRPDIPNAEGLHDSITNVLRRAVLFFVDIYVLYFVVSRSCSSRRHIVEVLAALCLACAVMAPMAVFETLRHWLLYAEVGQDWGGELMGQYLDRGGVLRAVVSTGHSLVLGYLLAIAMGFWLYLRAHVTSPLSRGGVQALMLLGLLAAYSRGPWIGALLIYIAFMALGPRGMPRLIKGCFVSALLGGLLLASPVGDRIVKVIPFLGGTVDAYNIDYRQRLMQRSLEMIQAHPWFGDQDAYSKLHDLRQGVGVIDFVNVYADVVVFYGLIGLFLFLSFILVGLVKSYRVAKSLKKSNSDLSLLGIALVACILGTLLMISASSFIFGYEKLFYVLGGLAAAYAHLGASERKQLESRPLPHDIRCRPIVNDRQTAQ